MYSLKSPAQIVAIPSTDEAKLAQISDNEKKAERAFRDSHYKSCKNGSKYLYELTGTGIGTAITIKCPVCGEEKNITDYDCW